MIDQLTEYLNEYGLAGLAQNFSIKVVRHNKYPNLVLLKYNQIDSPLEHPIVQTCRGIILDESNNWKVISFPYTKFFNHSEELAAKIDWDTAKIYEKFDGSLMTLYYYDNQWHVATSGTPDAMGSVPFCDQTFKDLFWFVWSELKYDLPPMVESHKCYMFELMTPYNRIVVAHKCNRIVLHGCRNLKTLKELDFQQEAETWNWEFAKVSKLSRWEDVVSTVDSLDPMKQEGYVVCDSRYNRIKVKSPKYVLLSHVAQSVSVRKLLEIVRTGEGSEFLSYFPEYQSAHDEIKLKVDELVDEIVKYFDSIKDIDSQKEFAAQAVTKKFSGVLFALRSGKAIDVRDSLAKMNIKQLEKWIDLKVKLFFN